jgi:hypothetical protein
VTKPRILEIEALHSGAHLIVTSNNIWVVCELTQDGVHCSCANSASIGIELVGDYSVESFDDGEGATIRDKAVYAMAVLHKKLGITPRPLKLWKTGLHFHRQYTADHHDCPGANVNTADVVKRVEDATALGSQTARAARGPSVARIVGSPHRSSGRGRMTRVTSSTDTWWPSTPGGRLRRCDERGPMRAGEVLFDLTQAGAQQQV